jgi:hypothetical protein
VISDPAMTALRCAAALVRAVPQTRVRVRHGDTVLVDVRRPPFTGDATPQVPPCHFHDAVSHAYAVHKAGRPLRFLDLPGGAVPSIDIGVPSGDHVFAGNVARVTMGPVWVHVVPIARTLESCTKVLGAAGLTGLGSYSDTDVDVTLLHVGTPEGDQCRARVAHELIESAVAHCTVAEIEEHLRAHAADVV